MYRHHRPSVRRWLCRSALVSPSLGLTSSLVHHPVVGEPPALAVTAAGPAIDPADNSTGTRLIRTLIGCGWRNANRLVGQLAVLGTSPAGWFKPAGRNPTTRGGPPRSVSEALSAVPFLHGRLSGSVFRGKPIGYGWTFAGTETGTSTVTGAGHSGGISPPTLRKLSQQVAGP
jgi:hypothetical protein